jgi:hypothetical protein
MFSAIRRKARSENIQDATLNRETTMKLIRLVNELRLISPSVFVACLLYIVASISLFLIFGNNNTPIGSLSSNLFAGSIDTLFTVILISYIIARRARHEYQPLQFAAYLQADAAIGILRQVWFDMIKASSLAMPPVGDDLLDEKYFDTVVEHLDLQRPSGIMTTVWVSRATAAGIQIKEIVSRITSRYATALSPEMILRCTDFENSGLINSLASLHSANLSFAAIGAPLQKPLTLSHSKESIPALRQFVAMVHEMAKDFEGEKAYSAPVSFVVTPEMVRNPISALGSARVE